MIQEQKCVLESTQSQRCFKVEFDRWSNADKSTLNQRGYHVDTRRDIISTYINVESTLSVCWDRLHTLSWFREERGKGRGNMSKVNFWKFGTLQVYLFSNFRKIPKKHSLLLHSYFLFCFCSIFENKTSENIFFNVHLSLTYKSGFHNHSSYPFVVIAYQFLGKVSQTVESNTM